MLQYLKDAHGNRRLVFLCLILWGTVIMVLVDYTVRYILEGEPLRGLNVEAAALSTILMVAVIIWYVSILVKRRTERATRTL